MTSLFVARLMSCKKKHPRIVNTIVTVSLLAVVLFVMVVLPFNTAFAADAGSMLSEITKIIRNMLTLVGAALIVFGGFTALLGYYQERPDDTSRGFRVLAVGAGLIMLAGVIEGYLVWGAQ